MQAGRRCETLRHSCHASAVTLARSNAVISAMSNPSSFITNQRGADESGGDHLTMIDEYFVALRSPVEALGRSVGTATTCSSSFALPTATGGRPHWETFRLRWFAVGCYRSSQGRGASRRAASPAECTLKAFGTWVAGEFDLASNPLRGVPLPRVPEQLVPSLRDPEIIALLRAVDGSS